MEVRRATGGGAGGRLFRADGGAGLGPPAGPLGEHLARLTRPAAAAAAAGGDSGGS